MAKRNKKRDSDTIDSLVAQVDKRVSQTEKSGERVNIQAICDEVGLRKETYYYRKRVESQAAVVSKISPVVCAIPPRKKATPELMQEFLELEKRMVEVKKELAKRIE